MQRSATVAVLFAAAALLTPAALPAQITTFVGPPRKAVADSAKPAVVAARNRADSVARMTLTDMKAWVDSAAGVNTQVASVSDTVSAATNPVPRVPPSGVTHSTTTLSNGAIAPNTATPLPTFLVAGLVSIATGMLLLGLRRRRT